jgi:O-antigen/teichoic acid export membrane protein
MKRLLKNAGFIITWGIITKLIFLILVVVMARKLGVEGVGIYSFVFAFIGLLFAPVGIGGGVAVRELAADTRKAPKYFWNLLMLRAIISLVIMMIVAVIIYFYPTSIEIKKAVYLCGLLLFFAIFRAPAATVLYALQNYKPLFLIGLTEDAVGVGFAVYFLILGKGIIGIITGFIIGSAVSMILSIVVVWKIVKKANVLAPDFVLWKRLVGKGSFFLMQKLLQMGMIRTDIIVLSLFGSTFLVGIYGAAAKVSAATILLPFAITMVMYPQYSVSFANSKRLLKENYYQILLYMIAIAIFVYAFLILFSGTIVHYVYRCEFSEAVPIIRILAIAVAIHAINMNNSIFLNAIRKEKLNVCLIGLIFITNAVLDLLWVKPYGMKGVAAATVFCAFAYCIVSTVVILKTNKRFAMNQIIPSGFQADMDEHG